MVNQIRHAVFLVSWTPWSDFISLLHHVLTWPRSTLIMISIRGICVGVTLCRWVPCVLDVCRVLIVLLCQSWFVLLSSKLMGKKNRKLAFLYTEVRGEGGRQVNAVLSLSAKVPVPPNLQ